MYEHNALGYRSSLALCLTKVRSSRACCPATALILLFVVTFLYQWPDIYSCICLILFKHVSTIGLIFAVAFLYHYHDIAVAFHINICISLPFA